MKGNVSCSWLFRLWAPCFTGATLPLRSLRQVLLLLLILKRPGLPCRLRAEWPTFYHADEPGVYRFIIGSWWHREAGTVANSSWGGMEKAETLFLRQHRKTGHLASRVRGDGRTSRADGTRWLWLLKFRYSVVLICVSSVDWPTFWQIYEWVSVFLLFFMFIFSWMYSCCHSLGHK